MSAELDLAERVLRLTDGDAQVTVTRERSLYARFARSAPTQATDVDDLGVDVLVVRDGQAGVASTNAVGDDDALRAAVRRATDAATAAAAHGHGDLPGLPGPAEYLPHRGFDPQLARRDPADAGSALAAIFAATAEARRDLEAFGLWTAGEVRVAIASSTGLRAVDAVTDGFCKVICRAPDGRSGYASAAAGALGGIDPAGLARRAAGKVPAGDPVALEPGDHPVVLGADAVGELVRFAGSLAFNGLTYAEGRSAISGRLGTPVAAPAITLIDDPRAAATLPRAFDAEGVAKAPLALIDEGVARAVVHDTRTAARMGDGSVSTGHALAPGGSPWGAAPLNLVLAGGTAAGEAELAAPIERGIYVTRLWYVNPVQPSETLLTGMTRDGTFLIEDGRITRPLHDVRFTDTALGVLARTEALGAQARLTSDGEFYGRRLATGVVCPPLRAAGLRITGGGA